MNEIYDVIIAGAGPVGLSLACELGLAGTSVLILERDLEPASPWKVAPLGRRGLNTPSLEMFYRRGLLRKVYDPNEPPSSFANKPGFKYGGHFAGMMLNANKIDWSHWKYHIPGPAQVPGPSNIERIEKALAERAESLGVKILRGHGVSTIVAQSNDSVSVETNNSKRFHAKWLVGCDGGRSVIRKDADFEFVGTESKLTGYAVKCDFDDPKKLTPGFHITETGMYIFAHPHTLYLTDFDSGAFDRSQEITLDHVQQVLDRLSGIKDAKIKKLHLASTYTDRSMQATSYRKGRIILAGDAAHIHSPLGAQGLNAGLGDAINLGWKLAATVRQENGTEGASADLTLLDTYESERQPLGAWVLEWTRAQVSALQPGPYGEAVRSLISDLMDTTDGTNLFVDRVWGLSLRYCLGDTEAHAHPLVGSSAPDFELNDGSRLGSKLEGGRGLLLDFEGKEPLMKLVVGSKYEARVDYISMGAKDRRGIRALLVRPDGFVAWLTEDSADADLDTAKAALEKWFRI
ncbi:putative pentachlorophenol 4-monooxygenase [Corynespora cassiicola Philippines]|uniref:Putative pentachlorophenol 4-monooxygenase n=1 Tax=Corynespora cassiicola Philippines TaxID=1448308 RepID=A0A2T2NRK8_CORCC|nr:putative pentachlorophenol 4-monooxygenase [Corynespora cassiicola Philippines]